MARTYIVMAGEAVLPPASEPCERLVDERRGNTEHRLPCNIVMAYTVMAYVVMALYSYGPIQLWPI